MELFGYAHAGDGLRGSRLLDSRDQARGIAHDQPPQTLREAAERLEIRWRHQTSATIGEHRVAETRGIQQIGKRHRRAAPVLDVRSEAAPGVLDLPELILTPSPSLGAALALSSRFPGEAFDSAGHACGKYPVDVVAQPEGGLADHGLAFGERRCVVG